MEYIGDARMHHISYHNTTSHQQSFLCTRLCIALHYVSGVDEARFCFVSFCLPADNFVQGVTGAVALGEGWKAGRERGEGAGRCLDEYVDGEYFLVHLGGSVS